MRVIIRLAALAWRYPWQLLGAYLCLIGASVATLAVPRLLGSAVDHALSEEKMSALVALALAIVGVSALRGVLSYGLTYLSEAVAQRVAYALRNELYDKLQHLSFAYHDRQKTGDLMSKATADVDAVRWFIQLGLLRTVQLVVLLGGAAGLMLVVNWRLALASLVVLPFALWRFGALRLSLMQAWQRIQRLLGEMTTVLQENLTGTRVVRAFGAEEFEQAKFNAKAQAIADASLEASMLQATNSAQMGLTFAFALGIILLVGAAEVANDRLTAGELTQFIFYHTLIAMPMRMMGFVVNVISRAYSAGLRIFEVLDAASPVQEKPEAQELGRVRGYVRFDRVNFSYRDGAPVLEGISFEAKPGQVVALLGAPGSGKTSIVNLIPRFYDVTGGAVTLDGIDVRDATLASLRRSVGIVMQDVFVFSATVRENVAYGHPDASDGDVERAARIAQLHEFIASLPERYDSLVGERGVTLSGGQQQRLAIARSVLLDPPVLILDDTMSSVDAETEARLKQALAEVMRGRTTFVIAHRLSTVLAADLILVLDKGRIAERGTHRELLEHGGLYREIYELQLLPERELATAGGVDGHQTGDGRALPERRTPGGPRTGAQ
ncbi:MAG: ABC transporter ATP-binding protein [Dehalococcoidia bacterium]|nr:ABC transporter ATP-binding protein [Dehalococcoidia bacterium]